MAMLHNIELANFRKLNFTEKGERYEYKFHLPEQEKYLTMIGNINVNNFHKKMLVNVTFSMQQDGYRFSTFVTNIEEVQSK